MCDWNCTHCFPFLLQFWERLLFLAFRICSHLMRLRKYVLSAFLISPNPTDCKGHSGCGGVSCLELLKLEQFVPLKYCIQQLKHCKLKLLMQIHLSSPGKLLCRGLGKCLSTADVLHVLAQVWMHHPTYFKKTRFVFTACPSISCV